MIKTMIVDHGTSIDERIEAAKKVLPYQIHIDDIVFRAQDMGEDGHGIYEKREYTFKLFEFPKGTSKKMMLYRIRRSGGIPADPLHMLAFAAQGFKDVYQTIGEYAHYVVGLGGELQTVLGAQFMGLNQGMCFFFQHLPQHKWTHDGGEDSRILAVRRIS